MPDFWYVSVSDSVMAVRLTACLIMAFINVSSWLFVSKNILSQSLVEIFAFYVISPLIIFFLTFDLAEYLQTKKFIKRSAAQKTVRSGLDAFFLFNLSLIVFLILLLLPFRGILYGF